MRGVVFTGERGLELMPFPDPTPDSHDVVIEMKASGMCGSDLHQYRRPKGQTQATGIPTRDGPVIAGHEPCGVVVAAGAAVDAKQARVGQRVMVHHYQGCTQCNHCRSGWQQLCQEVPVKVYGNNAHGGHAQYLKVPANTLVPLPDELSFSAGAAIACGSEPFRQRHPRGLRPGAGRAGGHAICQGDGRESDRARHQPAVVSMRRGNVTDTDVSRPLPQLKPMMRADIDMDVAAFADEAHRAPHLGGADRVQPGPRIARCVDGMIRPLFHPGTSMNVAASRSGLLAFMRKNTASPWLRSRYYF
jgi:Alcohol dehydrogenase GroES-like domain